MRPRGAAISRIRRMSAHEFSVSVIPQYLPEQSDPDRRVYAYSYTVTVINTGRVAAQLIARHWIITDGDGRVEEVRGLGVVGQQPFLKPGEAFEYTSWAQLATPNGSMRGSYFCVAEDGTPFEALIPELALVQPRSLH
jgi:ApaG protein